MLLAKIALYFFIFTLVLYLAHRALWLVFFLFNFRFWELILLNTAGDFMSTLSPLQRFLLLAFISILTYLSVYFTTMKKPLIRYIFLAVMFIAAIRMYEITDILFFKDYFESNGMWSLDYWVNQIKSVFTMDGGQITKMIDNVIKSFVDFFATIIDLIRSEK